MNKTIKVVIGANYGDEGKGLMTNYFCQNFPKNYPIMNVRYNGGAQAGHTVVLDDGTRVVFSHFGSGSLNDNVTTLLGEKFILNPMLFKKEWCKIISSGKNIKNPYIFSNGMVSFPMDMMINQFVEENRGENRHGSCGVGINETIEKYSNGIGVGLVIKDFVGKNSEYIFKYIKNNNLLWTYYKDRLSKLNVTLTANQSELFENDNILRAFSQDLVFMLDHTVIYDNMNFALSECNSIVFEGAQGLLLDMDNGINTTPSHTGLEYIVPFLVQDTKNDIEVCYVSRTHFTRHGAGSFDTECDKSLINEEMVDKTNVTNEFQGSFRYGWFDEDAFKSATQKQHNLCSDVISAGNKVTESICFTHTNETNGKIVLPDGVKIPCILGKSAFGTKIRYISDFETSVVMK
jgi:adenylosuccinate synthase